MTQQLTGTDAADDWAGVLDRVRGIVADAVAHDGEQALDLSVPATPAWSARDLLAHMAGLVASVLDGDEPEDHNPDWTQAHVDDRSALTGPQIVEEWQGNADAMRAYVAERDPRPLNDAVIHEQDLRGALDRPGARDTAGLASVRETLAERLASSLDGLPPVALRATDDGWSWASGDDDPFETRAERAPQEPPGVVLEASGFDLARVADEPSYGGAAAVLRHLGRRHALPRPLRPAGRPSRAEPARVSTHYDLIVIGAGSGNTIVDHRFDALKVAIVEKGPFGGTCLNRGCIPSKMFIHPADVAVAARRGPALGVPTEVGRADWSAIRDRIFTHIDHDAEAGRDYRQQADNVDVHVGEARFTGERRLVVDLEDGGSVEITADQVVVATGTRPVVPPIDGLDEVPFETSDTIMRIAALPARIGVLGGGYVGCELAHVFAAYGSEVVQVEGEDRLLATQDADVAAHFTKGAQARYDVRLGVRLESVVRTSDGVITLHLDDGSQAQVDVLLLAVGRVPNSDVLAVDRAGIETDDQGRIVVDEHQRTSADGVWALGDASSLEPLKHVANQDARVVQANLLAAFAGSDGRADADDLVTSDHTFVPQAVFAHPQVASVGPTEAEAREEHGDDVVVARHDIADVAFGWALAGDLDDDPEATGFVKLLALRSTGRLIGAHLIGPMASVLVQPLIQAMVHDLPVEGLARSQYWIHPSLAEVVENALISLESELAD